MSGSSSSARVLVVGAGMAGLSAAHELRQRGMDAVVVEARDRLGGRTWTDFGFADVPVELGAEFIHGPNVSTWRWVESLGLRTVLWTKTHDSMVRLADGAWLPMDEARARYPDFDVTRSWNLPDLPPRPNEDWRSYLLRLGFTRDQLLYVKRSYANACGESMRFLSAPAMLESIRGNFENGIGDYRILDGYGALVEGMRRDLDVRLNAPVALVAHDAAGVSLTLDGGETLEGDAAIVTLPVGVLQSGLVTFAPDLPERKTTALRGLRMGPVIKLVFRFDRAIVPSHVCAVYSAENPPMWWSPSFGHGVECHVWSAFVSGDWAMELLSLGDQGALDAALDALRTELGRDDFRVVDARLVSWPDDPYSCGGYSFVLPGHDGARKLLAEPTPPLFWAGEATEPEGRAATVHGAIESGIRAAHEVQRHLGRGTAGNEQGDRGRRIERPRLPLEQVRGTRRRPGF